MRALTAVGAVGDLDRFAAIFRPHLNQRISNYEIKFVAMRSLNATLSPRAITDRAAFLVYDDGRSTMRWGLALQGADYTALVTQWYDEMWAKIPPENLVYSHTGWNQKAFDLVRRQVESLATARCQGAE
jgi:hypothetical protein